MEDVCPDPPNSLADVSFIVNIVVNHSQEEWKNLCYHIMWARNVIKGWTIIFKETMSYQNPLRIKIIDSQIAMIGMNVNLGSQKHCVILLETTYYGKEFLLYCCVIYLCWVQFSGPICNGFSILYYTCTHLIIAGICVYVISQVMIWVLSQTIHCH